MKVEYTGRQYEITPTTRKQVEATLAKVRKVLGDNFETKVILIAEKHRQIAEITISIRDHSIVAVAEATDMPTALGEALDRIERQAIKYKSRWRARKRHSGRKKWKAPTTRESEQAMKAAVGANVTTAQTVFVHSFPSRVRSAEQHIVPVYDAVAARPLTLEEAVKEAQFRDREVFVFRDSTSGKVRVLHRTKDGKMELIDAP